MNLDAGTWLRSSDFNSKHAVWVVLWVLPRGALKPKRGNGRILGDTWSPVLILILIASPSLKSCNVIGSLTVTGEFRIQKISRTELTRINITPGDQVCLGEARSRDGMDYAWNGVLRGRAKMEIELPLGNVIVNGSSTALRSVSNALENPGKPS
jgi:hypothetical protein